MVPKQGDTRAETDRSFERLYRGHRGEVYRAALRELGNVADAEDVTQAAFVDAYRALLRGSQPRAPRAWLLAIAENVRRRRFRTALRRPREEPLDVDAAASTEPSDERADAVRSALAALPPQQREALLLREVVGLSYDEIAARLEATVSSVQMLLFRARRTLRAQLDPPSVTQRGRTLGLQLPPWLAHLVGRGDPLALTPRGAGAIGAAVLAVTGVTAGALHVRPESDPRPAPAVGEQLRPEPVSASASSPAPRSAVPAKPLVAVVEPEGAPAGRTATVRVGRQAVPPAPTPAPSVAQVPSAEPVVVQPPAAEPPLPPVLRPALVPPPARTAAPLPRVVEPPAVPTVPPLAALPPPPPVVLPAPPVLSVPAPPVLPVPAPFLPMPTPPVVLPTTPELPPAVQPPSPSLP